MASLSRLKRAAYTAAQWTWGLPQTLIGAGLYLKHRKDKHFDHQGACVTEWNRKDGISLGKFIFIPDSDDRFIVEHEYGHTIQSLILGPAYLLLVGAPSMLWNRSEFFKRRRRETGRSYYSAVFERTASKLGAKASARKDTK
ncbi:MAG: hypothetical protein E7220_01135 [Clostridiales bacterium]|nr:hypothetical protein [Clostridiales bacterium]